MQPVLLWASKSDVRHFKPLGSLAYSCTAALPSSSSRQLAGLPLLFLWASKSDVRHFAPPLNPPRAFKPFPAPLAYSCIAALLASAGSLGREPWNVQPVLLWASKSDVRHFKPLGSLAYSCAAALPSSSSRQLAGLPLLFLWASKSDVRHFAPPLNPPARLQTLPSAFGVLLHRSLALPLRQAGAWGESLWNVHRSLACVRREPGERASGTCSPCAAAPAPLAYSCIATAALPSYRQQACPPQRLREPGERASGTRSPCTAAPAPLAYSCIATAALPSYRQQACPPQRLREPGERASGTCSPCTAAPAPLAYSCIATAALPSYRQQACPPQRLQTLPSAFGLLLQRSLACVRREPGERALERAARAPMGFQKRR